MSLPEIPVPPKDIFDAIDDESFCLFIGSGVSQLLGALGWEDLCTEIIDECLSKDWITEPVREAYVNSHYKKRILNICFEKFVQFGQEERYFQIIANSCKGQEELVNNYNIYDEIKKIPAKYLSTNFDLLFSNKLHEDSVVFKNEDFDSENIHREVLYQIHGSLCEPDTIVLTTENYARKYTLQSYQEFLKTIFTENLILFIGCGLSEPEITIPLFNNMISENPRRNYALKGYKHNTLQFLQDDFVHYSTLGVELVAFDIEVRGYNLLFDILAYWNREITKNCDLVFKDLDQIERVAK